MPGGVYPRPPLRARFLAKIPSRKERLGRLWPKDKCWEWDTPIGPIGRGYISVNKRTRLASRVSWELVHGEIPPGLCVCHKCDNPSCVRPSHLFLGTPKQNTQDMIRKGRANRPYGEACVTARLTRREVDLIRRDHATGKYLQKELAQKYKTSNSRICEIVNYKSRVHG